MFGDTLPARNKASGISLVDLCTTSVTKKILSIFPAYLKPFDVIRVTAELILKS